MEIRNSGNSFNMLKCWKIRNHEGIILNPYFIVQMIIILILSIFLKRKILIISVFSKILFLNLKFTLLLK